MTCYWLNMQNSITVDEIFMEYTAILPLHPRLGRLLNNILMTAVVRREVEKREVCGVGMLYRTEWLMSVVKLCNTLFNLMKITWHHYQQGYTD